MQRPVFLNQSSYIKDSQIFYKMGYQLSILAWRTSKWWHPFTRVRRPAHRDPNPTVWLLPAPGQAQLLFPSRDKCSDTTCGICHPPRQAGEAGISEEQQQQRFIRKKCCSVLHWWQGWAAGKAHREEHYQQLSHQTEEKNFNKQNASKVLIILQSHHKKTIIQTVTFKERLCDGHLIKFTLKIQDAPLLLCLPLTGRRDKITPQLPSNLCFPRATIQKGTRLYCPCYVHLTWINHMFSSTRAL